MLALTQAACNRNTPPPTAPTPRVVALSPAIGATLHDFELDSLVVGRHAWDLALDPALPVCGETVGGQIDYEAVIAVQPTLIFGQFGIGGVPQRLSGLASARGWKVRRFEPLSLADVRTTAQGIIDELSAAGVKADTARAAIARLERSLAPRPHAAAAGRVLLLASVHPIAAFGPGSLHQDMLVAIGGSPALINGAAYQSLDAEDVIALHPDAIVVIGPRARHADAAHPSVPELAASLGRAGTGAIPAVLHGRVRLIDDPLAHLPATTISRVASELGDLLEEWGRQGPPAAPTR